MKALEDFNQTLERCPGCARAFRPEVLQNHLKQCARAQPKPKAQSRRPPLSTAVRQADAAVATVSRLARGQNAGPSTSPAKGGFGFAPAARQPGSSSRAAPSTAHRAKVRARSAAAPVAPDSEAAPGEDTASQCSEALVARGDLVHADAEDAHMLQEELELSLPGAEFICAFKIDTRTQHGIYNAMKASMCDKNSGQEPVEQELWHGTSWATVTKILRQGFNRSFAGRHGTVLGVATYFSADLAYSSRFCDRGGGGRDATKVVFLTRVLVGRFCKGSSTDVEPPIIEGEEELGTRYDSTVDNVDNPRIFAVFRDFQAVPLYLVEFRS